MAAKTKKRFVPPKDVSPEYHERRFTYLPYFLIVLLIGVFSLSGFDYQLQGAMQSFTLSLFVISLIFLLFNFQELDIDIKKGFMTFGFGMFKKQIHIEDIESYEETGISFFDYIGLGIKIGKGNAVAYSIASGPAVKICVKGTSHPYLIESKNAGLICRVIEESKSIR